MKRKRVFKKSVHESAGVSACSLVPSDRMGFSSKPRISPSPRSRSEDIEVVELRGTPRQRGQTHGEAARDKISELIEIWCDDLRTAGEADPRTSIDDFLENTRFPEAVKTWVPDLLEEVRGISDGSGIDYKTIFAFQVAE